MFEWFAGLDPQVQSGWIAGLTASLSTGLTVWLTQRYASKNLKTTLKAESAKHEAQLAEQRADRLFEARREVASRCLGAIQAYVVHPSKHEKRSEASERLNSALTQVEGELALLFSRELNTIVSRISTRLLALRAQQILDEVVGNTILVPALQTDDELNLEINDLMERLPELFKELTEAFSKELGTYEEPPVKKEA